MLHYITNPAWIFAQVSIQNFANGQSCDGQSCDIYVKGVLFPPTIFGFYDLILIEV